ncbi:hypothetical protein NDU88_001665 [Pleurodeles waltl]|uniref:Uncharacterized protein n=1 Tax=Pleurodeles waltl TaxID=8319 RepID=A0AAV7UTD4_PLEWA|nr:hypothetical protein NDU88_001665 [Pleurodeles waltl]
MNSFWASGTARVEVPYAVTAERVAAVGGIRQTRLVEADRVVGAPCLPATPAWRWNGGRCIVCAQALRASVLLRGKPGFHSAPLRTAGSMCGGQTCGDLEVGGWLEGGVEVVETGPVWRPAPDRVGGRGWPFASPIDSDVADRTEGVAGCLWAPQEAVWRKEVGDHQALEDEGLSRRTGGGSKGPVEREALRIDSW